MKTTRICEWCDVRGARSKGASYCATCKPVAARVHRNAIKAKNRALRAQLLSSLGCVDCGETDPRKLRAIGRGKLDLTRSQKFVYQHILSSTVYCNSCQAKRGNFGAEYKYEPGLPKPCTKCGIVQELEKFPPFDKAKTGRASWCHACHREHKRKKK